MMLQSTVSSSNRWEFFPLFQDHWQSPCMTSTTGGTLLAVKAVQAGCEAVCRASHRLTTTAVWLLPAATFCY